MLQRRAFGRTGHQSSEVIFGAAGLGTASQDFADRILDVLLEVGINHIDTAASYGDAELRIGPWMQNHRDKFFLATKTGARDGATARRSLEASLQRLGVDSIDLIQMHNLVEEQEWMQAHNKGGALEALVRARDEGLVRFIGVTGHGLRIARMHIRSLAEYAYDSVLFPYNFTLLSDAGYRSDVDELIGVCRDRGVAMQSIKAVARRRWRADQPVDSQTHSWYEPLRDSEAISHAVGFVLGREDLFLNCSSDYTILRKIINAAEDVQQPVMGQLTNDVTTHSMEPLFDGKAADLI